MKKKNICFKKVLSAALAIAAISSVGFTVCADDTVYYSDNSVSSQTYFYTDSFLSVSGNNLIPNIDNSEKLSFSISNISGKNLMFLATPTDGAIEQKKEGNSWNKVSGDHGEDPSFDDMTPADVYSKIQLFPAYSTYSYDMDVSFLDAGEYRLKVYLMSADGEYIEDYIYFSVSENVSASAENVIYTSSPKIDVKITNNLPVDISSDFSKDLEISEYIDGKWTKSDIKLTNTSEKSTIKSGKTSTLKLSFKDIDSSDAGKYRLTAKFKAEKSVNSSYPDSKTISVDFTLEDPADIEILSATVSSRDDLYVNLKIKNNTNETITADNIGRLAKEANSRWINVSYKNKAKTIGTESYTINPGEEKIVKVYLSDYYRTSRLSIGLAYRINIDINGKTYYRYFKLSKGTIQSESNNSDSNQTYYIIDETAI